MALPAGAMAPTEQDDTIDFARRLLALVQGATTTTTYKFALLLALIDLAQENVGRADGAIGRTEGEAGSVTTRQIAERVVALYWPQTLPYGAAGTLRQLTSAKASLTTEVAALRRRLPEASTSRRARELDRDAYEDLVDRVELTFIRYPIPLLQRLGGKQLELLYVIRWDEQPPLGPIKLYQRACRRGLPDPGGFDSTVRFLPGVERRLATLADLLRPIVQREWARFVARCNDHEAEDLERFLFEPKREQLAALGGPLLELQRGTCFYCASRLRSARDVHVDHFLPWSRSRDDGLHNLVAAHARCNVQKSDHFAAREHVERWRRRLTDDAATLVELAREYHLDFDPEQGGVRARSTYLHLPGDFQLWLRGDEFEPANHQALRDLLTG